MGDEGDLARLCCCLCTCGGCLATGDGWLDQLFQSTSNVPSDSKPEDGSATSYASVRVAPAVPGLYMALHAPLGTGIDRK